MHPLPTPGNPRTSIFACTARIAILHHVDCDQDGKLLMSKVNHLETL